MYKFFKILFLICVFIICGFGGAYLSEQALDSQSSSALKESESTSFQTKNQIKLIVFFLDELDQKSPQLQSVWTVNFFYAEPNQLTFIQLTEANTENFNKLSKKFFINEKNDLAPATLKAFEKFFQTGWDGSIMIDQTGAARLLSWLTENQITVSESVTESDTQFPRLTYVCQYLNERSTPIPNTFDWSQLSNKDFITSLSIDEIFRVMQTLTDDLPPQCKIILPYN